MEIVFVRRPKRRNATATMWRVTVDSNIRGTRYVVYGIITEIAKECAGLSRIPGGLSLC